ncbi:unnamed protein product [Adineta ricciae]|uniref:Uncharacterized protein n=1 Tax=Adineta ricciae TaxID=249248 RepID=A0A815YPE9_ADIRI|nr:unnamed protein product [Adineta ricciae]
MTKTNAERQKLYRINLSKDKSKLELVKAKARRRDNARRKNLDARSLENLRLRQKNASKRYREKLKSKGLTNSRSSTYQSRQTLGKAVQRTLKALPKDPNKRHHVVHHIAQLFDVIPKSTATAKREQRSLSIETKRAVEQFYNRDDISYQMPGKRDCVTFNDDNGQRVTVQKRILLCSIRETYQLFLAENKDPNISLSTTSFTELRPIHVLLQSSLCHRSCLCSYHENVNLLLKSLSKHVKSTDLNSIQTFLSAPVCNEQNEDCMFSRCSSCSNNFDLKVYQNIIDPNKQIQWSQWTSQNGFPTKEEFTGSVKRCATVLKEQIGTFLAHVFIKRQQSAFFENLKSNLDDQTICIQVDFSENFHIDVQDAIQSSFYSKDSVSLFTCYIWHSNGGQSYVCVADELSHDKYHVNAALEHIFQKLKSQFSNLKEVHVFSDGATQQFKQRFLFRNLCRLSAKFKIDLSWHFFATTHGKGVVDGIGGSLKRLVYLAILSGLQCKSAADFVKIGRSKTAIISIDEIEQHEIDDSKTQLEHIFKSVKPVPETKKIHSIKAIGDNIVEYKYYSNSKHSKKYRFSI